MRIPFPLTGVNRGRPTHDQPQLSSPDMNNMRLFDVLDNRARGGQRPALDKWGDGDLIGDAEQPIVAICVVHSVE